MITTSTTPFERSSNRRKGFPSETQVKRVYGSYTEAKTCTRSLAVTISVHAAPEGDFKRCCLASGRFDGTQRNYFFPFMTACLFGCPILRVFGEGWDVNPPPVTEPLQSPSFVQTRVCSCRRCSSVLCI